MNEQDNAPEELVDLQCRYMELETLVTQLDRQVHELHARLDEAQRDRIRLEGLLRRALQDLEGGL